MKKSISIYGLKGWKNVDSHYPLLPLCLMILLSASVHAEQESNNEEPDAVLLEYLGEWETAKGEWIDPLELDSLVTASCSNEQEGCHE